MRSNENWTTTWMIKERKPRVLVLDDDKFMLEFISHLLRELGASEVLVAQDGKAGLFVLSTQIETLDLIICDIEMPGMDGIEFLRNIANLKYDGKIALFSGIDADLLKAAERLAIARGLNVIGTLAKPITMERLSSLLAQLSLSFPRQDTHSEIKPVVDVEEIRQAMLADQFDVFYQPKVAISDRHVAGVECLARWRHDKYGYISPDNFISLIEQHGLINEFTLGILRKSVRQLDIWLQQGLDLRISVNVSVENLDRCNLPEIFEEAVHEANVPVDRIILEITESRLSEDFALSLDILTRLRLKGFGLAIDDFGTGYATMEMLKHMPFTELKIDQIFTNGAANDPSTRAILESSIQLGKIFGLNIVAEGIETQSDWDLVAELGCNEVQGYFIAKPMPFDELIKWLSHHNNTRN